jgi:hypothetical protein
VSQNNQHRPLMVQAPVRALDPDGVAVVTAGTLAFAVGAVVCWLNLVPLTAMGKGWYLGVAVTGTVLGLLGLAWGLFRKLRRKRSGQVGDDGSGTDELPHRADAAPRRAAVSTEDESAKA